MGLEGIVLVRGVVVEDVCRIKDAIRNTDKGLEPVDAALLEGDDGGLLVRGLDRLNRVPDVDIDRSIGGGGDPLPGEDEIVRGHRLAVAPGEVRQEGKGRGQQVFAEKAILDGGYLRDQQR